MKKIISWLMANNDKVLHFVVCMIVAALVAAFDIKVYGREVAVAAAIGGFTAFGLGVAKEVYDFITKRDLSFGDLLADIVGAVAGGLLFVLIV